MFALLSRLIGGAVAPLVDRVAEVGAVLLRKLALFFVAGICFVVVLIALTIAFDVWVASHSGPVVGALAVAGVYLLIGIGAGVAALRTGVRPAAPAAASVHEDAPEATTRAAQIDEFARPLVDMLSRLGLRKEQLAVLAGASMAKQLRPVPLVGLAILAGFLLGRMWKGWDALLSTDLLGALLSLIGLRQPEAGESRGEAEDIAA